MQKKDLDIPAKGALSIRTADVQPRSNQGRSLATKDHEVIRAWAARHRAEPATGEATASGPATISVNDGGAGVRFNFPGAGLFRPISWDEWFESFDRDGLVFVYEEEVADRAHAMWQDRGAEHGQDQRDWFEAERELKGGGAVPTARYRFVQQDPRRP
jgi:hypothetical protein